ncbi:MAG TPA: ABC transporter permease [Aggregatilineales bacterium]|nr:ABC transporter permease [Aggregatilineales bacterium]
MATIEKPGAESQENLERRIINVVGEQGFIVIFIAWCIYLYFSTDNFGTTNNVFTILRQASIIGIVAIGAHFIILLGDIDLSPAATLTLCGVVMAKLMVEQDYSPWIAGGLAVSLGLLIGLVNALIITGLKINAIITTLGTSSVLAGIALTLTAGKTVFGDQIDAIEFLSRQRILDDRIPLPVIILFVLYAVAFVILRRTVFGAWVFAVGNNSRAAWLSGINVSLVKIIAYMLAGGLAAFGGIMQVARQGTATGAMGSDFLFPILTAVVLGGASLSGGRGKVFNTLIAAIFLTTITNGMVLLNYDVDTQRVVSGVILIVALSLDRLRTVRV